MPLRYKRVHFKHAIVADSLLETVLHMTFEYLDWNDEFDVGACLVARRQWQGCNTFAGQRRYPRLARYGEGRGEGGQAQGDRFAQLPCPPGFRPTFVISTTDEAVFFSTEYA